MAFELLRSDEQTGLALDTLYSRLNELIYSGGGSAGYP